MKKAYWILIVFAVGVLLYTTQTFNRLVITSNERSGISGGGEIIPSISTQSFITVNMFDLNGNTITESNKKQTTVSVNGGPQIQGVGSVTFTILLSNTGGTVLNCSLSPQGGFTGQLPTDSKLLAVGANATWTTPLIDISGKGLVGSETYALSANCNYYVGTNYLTITKPGSITLSYLTDPTGGVDIGVSAGGISTVSKAYTYTPSNIIFRTSDTSYAQVPSFNGAGVALQVTKACGSPLTAYAFVSSSGVKSGSCTNVNVAASNCVGITTSPIFTNLPGGFLTNGNAPVLFKPVDNSFVCICDEDASGNYEVRRYSGASSMNTNIISTQNPATEVTC